MSFASVYTFYVMCSVFCTGHLVIVHINLNCLQCLQPYFCEHLKHSTEKNNNYFVCCVHDKSKFLISFEKGIDFCEFDVLEAMLLYLACQIVAIDPRVLLSCLLANVNV